MRQNGGYVGLRGQAKALASNGAPQMRSGAGFGAAARPGAPPNYSPPMYNGNAALPMSNGNVAMSANPVASYGGRLAAPAAPVPPGRPMTPRASPMEETPRSPRSGGVEACPAPAEVPAADPAAREAIQISGCTGKYKLINDVYEPMQMSHQNRPCWCARSAAPVYLFHTGKSRWVISKRINDGARCYAFIPDNGSGSPTTCAGPWMCCGDDGQWNPDPNITCAKAQASQDQFVLLRVQVEEDLAHYGLMDSSSLKQLWRKLDKDGNNVVSLAEIDLLVSEMVKTGVWPAWLHNKQAMQRAYEKTTKMDDNDGDDFVEKEEFHSLLLNLFWFGHLHQLFEDIDTDHDDKMSLQEFMQGMSKLGLQLSEQEAQAEFRTIDMDHGGNILFAEFCAYVRKRIHPDHNPAFDAEVVSRDKSSDTLRKKHGDKATHGQFVQKKNMADFDQLEAKIKGMMNDNDQLRKLWTRLDFNGNRIVSLAEVDKMVNEQYPLLNHKPALMRAFQATLRDGDGDEWVEKHEFKMLLGNLFYFNKLFWLFDQVDEDKDRRMTYKEFKWCLAVCGLNMSDTKCQSEFKKVDVNGGGIILFDEFCRYFTDKHCPDSMKEFVDQL